jgi:acyl-CoA dehydrogenase
MYHAQEQLHSFLRNFPNRPVAFFLRRVIFPRGRTYHSPTDELGKKIVGLITQTGESRDRLSAQAFTTLMPNNPLGLLQEALVLSERLAPLEKKLRQAKKEGLIKSDYFGYQIEEAASAEIISDQETADLREYHEKTFDLLSVDDFSPDEISRCGANDDSPVVAAMTDTAVTQALHITSAQNTARKPAKKKVARKTSGKKSPRKVAAKKNSPKKMAEKKTSKKKK